MAIEKNIRVKLRLSALITEIGYKGDQHRRGPREVGQQKVVIDAPVAEYTDIYEWYNRRVALNKVIVNGWEIVDDPPCEVWMGDLTVDPITAIASFNAKVRSNNTLTTVTWWIDITPGWDTAVTQAANESPVTSADDEMVTGTYDFSAFRGMTFYIQCGVTDGAKITYSIIKSIEIPTIV